MWKTLKIMEIERRLYLLYPDGHSDFQKGCAEMKMVAKLVSERCTDVMVYLDGRFSRPHNLLKRYCNNKGIELKVTNDLKKTLADENIDNLPKTLAFITEEDQEEAYEELSGVAVRVRTNSS